MSQPGSVTLWITRLKGGDPAALQPLWERYYRRLVGLARARLLGGPRGAADEEDVALSAFESFYRGVEGQRFPRLDDRDDLWRLLMLITARKAVRLLRDELRLKRGGGRVLSLSPEGDAADLDAVVGEEPSPEFAAQVAEELQRLLDRLQGNGLRTVALGKMEGYTNEEIAERLRCAPRTVERKLHLIRELWQAEVKP